MEVNTIILGDCLEIMKEIPSQSVDLVLTDPPYGMEYQSARRTAQFDKIENDVTLEWVKPFLVETYRILKDNTHIYIFCNDYAISDFRKVLEGVGFTPKRTLVWVKNNHTSGDLEGDYGNKTEFVLYAQKGRRELIGKRETNVLNYSRVGSMMHPTQKPEDMFEFLISKSSNEGDLVLDPFGGSCTTAVAAKHLKRNYICIEKNETYVNVCNDRLSALSDPLF